MEKMIDLKIFGAENKVKFDNNSRMAKNKNGIINLIIYSVSCYLLLTSSQ